MNHERLPSEDRTPSYSKKNRIVRPQNQIESNSLKTSPSHINQLDDSHQVILFRQILWSWWQQSPWYNFGRGFFWGAIVGLTAVASAGGGVALTKIDAIEQAIVRTIKGNLTQAQSTTTPTLTHPLNVLLLEVKPSAEEMIKSSQGLAGESKTILLLKFQPNLDRVQVIYLPTNSRVKIPGFGWGTLADANQYGGVKLVSELVIQLSNGSRIDRYIRGTPETFNKLIASGKITLDKCDVRFEDCSDNSKQVSQKQAIAQTIRQRLNIPAYLNNFKASLTEIQPDLDTNLSISEAMAIANFVKEVDPQKIKVSLSFKYTPGKAKPSAMLRKLIK